MKTHHVSVALAAVAGLALTAQGSNPTAIYTNISTLPNSLVPGSSFGDRFLSFDRPLGSQNGQHWALLARNTTTSATDAMYLTGSGTSGSLKIHEGITEIESGRFVENMSDRRIGINDNGDWAVGVNLTGATTDDQVAIRGNSSGGFAVLFREGQSIAGQPAGWNWGTGIADVHLANNGDLGLRATINVSGSTPGAIFRGSGAALDSTTLGGNAANVPGGVGGRTWTSTGLPSGVFAMSADGTKSLMKGTISGDAATNQLLVVNNNKVLQEGDSVTGASGTVSNIISQRLSENGDWFARGETTTDSAFVIRNGVTLATSGDLVPGGLAGERFSNGPWNITNANTFLMHTGNSVGDYIYAGFTDNADASKQVVWVLNNGSVVLREGDQIDVDGDGMLDNAYIDVTGLNGASLDNMSDSGFLTNDLWFYFTSNLRDASGAELGQAFLRVQVPAPGALGMLGLAGVIAGRRRRA